MKIIRVDDWNDNKVKSIRNDCMEMISRGVWIHHRLEWVIVVASEIHNNPNPTRG